MRSFCPVISRMIAVGLLLALIPTAAQAQRVIWDLKYRNQFTVETTIRRQTTISIDDQTPVVRNTTEVLTVNYRVRRMLPTAVVLTAQVQKCRLANSSADESTNQKTEEQLSHLENLSFQIQVARDGGIDRVELPPELVRQLGGSAPAAQSILRSTLTEGTITSWLGRPFWLTVEEDDFVADTEWQQLDEVALGLLGQIRTIVTCRIENVEASEATVSITGKTRHLKPPAMSSRTAGPVLFDDIKLTATEFKGQAVMKLADEELIDKRTDKPQKRPLFESLTLQWDVKGETTVGTGERQRQMTFAHQQTETSRLVPGFFVGDDLFRAPVELQINP